MIVLDWVIFDATENKKNDGSSFENIVKNIMANDDYSYKYFNLRHMNITTCLSCASCAHRTPGKCVVKDDMPDIIRAIAISKGIILITPIVFGGYSSHLKKAVDKFTLIGLPLYEVKKGEMVHPMRYGYKHLLGIGISQKNNLREEENFRLLVKSNASNMQCPYHKALILNSTYDSQKIENEISNMIKEVPK